MHVPPQVLWLSHNQIGDEGMISFSGSLSRGTLPQLTFLGLGANHIGDEGMKSLSEVLGSGALANLQVWAQNLAKFGSAFLTVCRIAQDLRLWGNQIGDAGMKSFSEALSSGALASIDTLYVDDGPLGTEHPALKAACEARGIRLP